MRSCVAVIVCVSACVSAALAQQSAKLENSYIYDVNGRRVETGISVLSTQSKGASSTVERALNANGRLAPLEAIEEQVLREDANGRIVERTIRRYDANGIPGPPEKQRIEETRQADGGTRTLTTLYRGDINGALQIAERTVAETRKNADTETTRVTVEKPSLNGAFEAVERRESTNRKTAAGLATEASTYRRDENGRFFEAQRLLSETKTVNGQSVANLSQYELKNSRMELSGQTVTRTRRQPDGSETSEVEIYKVDVPGRPVTAGKPVLLEQQLIERQPGQGQSLVESVTVRRTSPNAPDRLGEPRKISERVCQGSCR